MTDDLITSLRALAAAQHSDLTFAADAADRIERLTRERNEARDEVERQARHIEELMQKIDAERSCACSFDAPGDVCAAHSPALTRALVEVEQRTRERDEARAEIENLYDQIHRWVDDRAKAQSQADRLREQNYELQRERDEARAWAAKLLATLEMARDADNDCRVEGWATIPDAVRRSIDEALEAKP